MGGDGDCGGKAAVEAEHCLQMPLGVASGFPGGSDGKESVCSVEDPGVIPGLGRPPGEGNGSQLQYSSLENSMARGA